MALNVVRPGQIIDVGRMAIDGNKHEPAVLADSINVKTSISGYATLRAGVHHEVRRVEGADIPLGTRFENLTET